MTCVAILIAVFITIIRCNLIHRFAVPLPQRGRLNYLPTVPVLLMSLSSISSMVVRHLEQAL